MDQTLVMLMAFIIIPSAVVRGMSVIEPWRAVDEGRAKASHLATLTGVKPEDLPGVFGPPTLDGRFIVSRADVQRRRGWRGVLLSETRLDLVAILVAIGALLMPYSFVSSLVILAFGHQLAGWAALLV